MSFENNTSINEVLRRIKLALKERELRASAMAAEGDVSIAPSRRSSDPRISLPSQEEFADDIFVLSKSMKVGSGEAEVRQGSVTEAGISSRNEAPNFSNIDWDDFYRLLSRRTAAFLRASNSALLLEDWLRENFVSIVTEAKG